MKNTSIVIGGGFYGCIVALELNQLGHQVTLIEQESDLLLRASYVNQARIHQGYHYPRNILTAVRSSQNFTDFVAEFSPCVVNEFDKYYAIARKFSKITAKQFQLFCQRIGAPIAPAPDHIKQWFNPVYIEDVFQVKEYAFNADILRQIIWQRLRQTTIKVILNARVNTIKPSHDSYEVHLQDGDGEQYHAQQIFNCTYAGLNQVNQAIGADNIPLKHEYIEMALVELPPELNRFSVTVMDGPFFSLMPFPSKGWYSLSHVRYTPHHQWFEQPGAPPSPYSISSSATSVLPSHYRKMQQDVARYMPLLEKLQYKQSLWDIKTVLPQNEGDDGRPILFQSDTNLPGYYAIMGGKIDNIADVRLRLNELYS